MSFTVSDWHGGVTERRFSVSVWKDWDTQWPSYETMYLFRWKPPRLVVCTGMEIHTFDMRRIKDISLYVKQCVLVMYRIQDDESAFNKFLAVTAVIDAWVDARIQERFPVSRWTHLCECVSYWLTHLRECVSYWLNSSYVFITFS